LDVAVGGADEEILFGVGADVPPSAQNRAGLVLCELKVTAAPGLHLERQTIAEAAELEIGTERNDGEIVLLHAHHGAYLFEYADDEKFRAAQAEGVTHRVEPGEEFGGQTVADQAHLRRMLVLDLGKVSPTDDGAGIYLG